MKLKLLLMLFMVFVFYGASAQTQQSIEVSDIKGFVKDSKSGEALPYASVSIFGTKHGTTTNQNGYFVLVDAPKDTIILIINYIGYASQSVKLNNREKNVKILNIQMAPTAIELKGVTITANAAMLKAEDQISQISISPRQIATLPNIGEVDIFRSLQLLPGINAGSSGSSEMYIRGGTPDQNLVLFDGMTIYHVDHFFGFFSAFNAEAVKDIQVYKGGFPAEYGGRMSSVVNMTGKTGDENKTRFKIGLNLLSVHSSLEAPLPIFEKTTFLIALRRSYTDFIQSGLYDDIYKTVTGQDIGSQSQLQSRGGGGPGGMGNMMQNSMQPSFYFYDFNSKLTMSPSSKDIVSLSFYSGKDDLDQSQDFGGYNFRFPGSEGNQETQGTFSIGDYTKWGNLGISGKWSRQWSDRFHTEMIVAHSKYFSNYSRSATGGGSFRPPNDSVTITRGFAQATKEDNTVQDMSYRIDSKWNFDQAHTLGFGLWSTQFNADYISLLNDTTELIHQSNTTFQHALYVQDKWHYNNLEVILGLRSNYYMKNKKMYFEQRLSLGYSIFEGLTLKGAWGNYYQFVNRITNENVLEGNRDFWLIADENLKPSRAEHLIAGLNYETDSYLFSVEGYLKNYDNLLQYSRRFNGIADYQNRFFFGTGVAKGIEFLLQKKVGNLTGWLGYTLAKVDYTFPKLNDGIAFPAEQDHRHDIKMVAKYVLDDWEFAATWVYATGNAYTAPESQYFIKLLNNQSISYIHVSDKNSNRLPDFHRLDLSVSKHFEADFADTEVGLSVFNVYNHTNVSYRQYNLSTTPITVTDVVQLGLMPTVYVQFNFK